ncbi:MAG: DUF2065 domain-containing protein [Alphaproteobacteria bacterium]|jgi:uncharacterized protein YjeT (DUF2065 family)
MLDFLTALCLVLVLEGALYALFPDGMKRTMAQVLTMPSSTLRTAGLTAAGLGVLILWLVRG